LNIFLVKHDAKIQKKSIQNTIKILTIKSLYLILSCRGLSVFMSDIENWKKENLFENQVYKRTKKLKIA